MPIKKSISLDQQIRLARHRARLRRLPSPRNIKQTLSKRSIRSKRSIDTNTNETDDNSNLGSIGMGKNPFYFIFMKQFG